MLPMTNIQGIVIRGLYILLVLLSLRIHTHYDMKGKGTILDRLLFGKFLLPNHTQNNRSSINNKTAQIINSYFINDASQKHSNNKVNKNTFCYKKWCLNISYIVCKVTFHILQRKDLLNSRLNSLLKMTR